MTYEPRSAPPTPPAPPIEFQPVSGHRASLRTISVLFLLLLALSLFLTWRGFLPTWGDEAFTFRLANQSSYMFRHEIQYDVHPPLYFWLTKIITGMDTTRYDSPTASTVPRILAYLILLALVWSTLRLAARRVLKPEGMIFPAILIATSAHLALFGPMMRYYALSALGVTCATLLLMPPVRVPPGWPRNANTLRAVWYGLSLWVAFASAYLTVIVLPAHIIWLLKQPESERKPFLLSLLWVGIASLPLLWLLKLQLAHGSAGSFAGLGGILKGAVARLAFTIYSFTAGEFIRPWDWWFSIPLLIAFVILLIYAWKSRNTPSGSLLWLTLSISMVIGVLGLSYVGVGIEFCASRLFFLAPMFLLLLALGPSSANLNLNNKQIALVAIIILAAFNLYSSFNYSRGSGWIQSTYIIPWNEIATDIENLAHDDSVILHDDETLIYYLPQHIRNTLPVIDLRRAVEDYNMFEEPAGLDHAIAVYSPRDGSIEAGIPAHLFLYGPAWEPDAETTIEYVLEDETSMHWKSMLLGRRIYEVKKILIVYNAAG